MSKKKVYVCDNCGKQTDFLSENEDFPYKKNWFAGSIRIGFNRNRLELVEGHFCSLKCLLAKIKNDVEKKKEESEKKGENND